MTNKQLMNQFDRCKKWNDADQWDILALEYFRRGFTMNAEYCFKQAEKCRAPVMA